MNIRAIARVLRLFGVLALLAGVSASAETRRAVLAGCNTYADGLSPLATSLNDIQGVKERVLCAPGGYWQSADTVTLKDSQATRQRVRDEIAAAAEASLDGDVFFFMYSGHGTQEYDYEYYELLSLYDDDYGDWEIGEDLAQFSSGVKIVVMLDTCYSGGIFKSATVPADQLRFQKFAERVLASYQKAKLAAPLTEPLASKAVLGANLAFMTASDKYELSWIYDSGYSLYSGYVLKGAQAFAADANADRAVTFKELHDYAVPRVVADTRDDEVQTPQSYHPDVLASIVALGAPDVIRMELPGVTVSEGGGRATVRLVREGSAARAASVEILTVGESAVPGKDYAAPTVKTVAWAAGDTAAKSVLVALTDDKLHESPETFWVMCVNPKQATLDAEAYATLVTILDNDAAAPGSVRIAAPAAAVAENAGFVTLTVTRAGGSDGAAQVRYRTVQGTAAPDADYDGIEGALTWGPGDGSSRAVRVAVRPDAVWEADETFAVELFDASGATLGAPAAATVTIKNFGTAKAPGLARLTAAAVSVCEAEGVARVTVAREGGSDGAVEATITAVSGTAKAGVNFAPTSRVLRWVHGDAAPQAVEVALLNDGLYKPDLTFKLQLGGYKGGLAGAPNGAGALVTLRDALSAVPLSGALDAVALMFTAGATGGWYGQAGESGAAQLYGAGVAKGKDAWMQTAVTGPGLIAFSWRGGAQAGDVLQFLIGTAVKTQLVGQSGWERVEGIVVPAGLQTLKWRFLKVSAASDADDTAWVDQVAWQPDAAKPAGPSPTPGGLVTSDPPQLAWRAAADAAAYTVYLGASASAQLQLLGQTSDTVLALPALLPGQLYYWRVDAASASGRVTTGAVWSFRVPAGALARIAHPEDQTLGLGLPFALALTLREGSPAVTAYSVKGLPAGLASSQDGVISGRPTKLGVYTVTVAAVNGFGTGPLETFTLTVEGLPAVLAGQFAGLSGVGDVAPGQGRNLCGAVQMTVTPAGAISGNVRLAEGSFRFSGVFLRDAEGLYFETPIKHKSGKVSTFQVWPYDDPALAQQGYRGWLFNDEDAPRELVLARNVWAENRPALAEYAGYYTVALPLGEANGAEYYPLGTGYLTVKLEATGTATLAGVLSDGTAWSGSAEAFFAPDGDGLIVPVFASLYKGVGQFWGVLRIAQNGAGVSDNTVRSYDGAFFGDAAPASRFGMTWQSGVLPDSRLYPDGFDLDLTAAGGAYNTGAMSAEARLGNPGSLVYLAFDPIGDAAYDPSLTVALSGSTVWLPPAGMANPCGTTLRVDGLTGLFTGNFTLNDTVSGKAVLRKITYKGVLAPLQWTYGAAMYDAPGSGFFLANGLSPTPATSWIDSLGVQLLWLPLE